MAKRYTSWKVLYRGTAAKRRTFGSFLGGDGGGREGGADEFSANGFTDIRRSPEFNQ